MPTTDRHEQAQTADLPRYAYLDGSLCAEDCGKTYRRPCDWAADCGPEAFLGGPRPWTPAARAALTVADASTLRPMRGLPDDFLVFAVEDGSSVTICGLACAPTTLTVRFEDAWEALPPELRAYSYRCSVTRDPHAKDAPSARQEGVVRETLTMLAPDARIFLDLADSGGFVLSFQPEQ